VGSGHGVGSSLGRGLGKKDWKGAMEERDRHLLALIDQGYTVEDLKRELSARA